MIKVNNNHILGIACVFSIFLAGILLKYVLYDNGFAYKNLLLLAGLWYIRVYLLHNETSRMQECMSLLLFILFDKDLLDIFNVILIVGAISTREQLLPHPILKESVSLSIGLIFLLMGWFNVGKIFVIYSLIIIIYVGFGTIIAGLTFIILIRDGLEYLRKRATGNDLSKDAAKVN